MPVEETAVHVAGDNVREGFQDVGHTLGCKCRPFSFVHSSHKELQELVQQSLVHGVHGCEINDAEEEHRAASGNGSVMLQVLFNAALHLFSSEDFVIDLRRFGFCVRQN
jgi:hypothetical protein